MKNNVRDIRKVKGKEKEPTVYIPRFIRVVRTPNSERYTIIMGEGFEPIGTIDLHIDDEVHVTVVIIPEVEQDILDLLVTFVKMELLMSLEREVGSFHVYKGVSECITFDEEDLFDDDDYDDDDI